MRIAVVGGTGTAGSAVVRCARARGHHVAVLARSTGVDVTHGGELVLALQGMDAVVDATNAGVSRRRPAVAWFEGVARSLTDAAHRARVGLILPLSIVGIDDVPLGYYEGKRAQEAVVQGSPVPWTIVRATQFFSFPSPFLDRARVGVALIPALRCQPVAVEAVARFIVDALESPERGQVLQVAGPQEWDTVTMARRISACTGGPRVWPLPVPGAAGRAIGDGRLLPGPDARIDEQDFDAWLAATY